MLYRSALKSAPDRADLLEIRRRYVKSEVFGEVCAASGKQELVRMKEIAVYPEGWR